jgi:hypothetical protein
MKLWRLMLLILCLSITACTSTRDFYETVYSSLQFQTNTRNAPDSAPYLDRPMSFQQYEDEREALLEPRDK